MKPLDGKEATFVLTNLHPNIPETIMSQIIETFLGLSNVENGFKRVPMESGGKKVVNTIISDDITQRYSPVDKTHYHCTTH